MSRTIGVRSRGWPTRWSCWRRGGWWPAGRSPPWPPIRACRSPLEAIADNAGQDGGIVAERVAERKGNEGYNAATDEYEDLVKAGVIDPTKVTRTALQNASSVATLLLTSDALIAEAPKKEKKGGGGHGHGGMDDMY